MNRPWRVKLFLLSWYSVLQLLTAQEAQSQLTETDGRLQRRANALRRKRDLLGEETFSPLLSEATLPRSVLHNYTARDASSEYCGCLNGGWCQEGGVCDCAQFQALGDRCQIIPNQGQDRDGICRSWGQYHYETFDGSYFYYPGTCSYILAQDCRSATPQYTVWVHNSRVCEGSVYSCPRALSLFFPNEEEIHISGYQVHQGGRRLSLPQTIGGVFIERLADYLLVKSVFGFSLAWDGGSGVYLKMSEQHHGTPCGLCGNYNNLPNDDLTTARGVQTEEPAMFANSWSVDLPHERGCPLVDIDFTGPCHSESDMDDAIEKCSALLFFPFLSCHENIDPNPYLASCVSDLCVSDEEETFCRALVEYTRACSHVGYPVREWRDSFPSCNDGCEESFVHRDCISCCPPTCTFDKECLGTNLHCLDGCYCPDGLILQNGTCIAVSQCPCVYHGTSYTQGHTLEQGCSVCVCMGGVWNCTDNNCTAECSVVGDVFVTSFDGRMFLQPGECQYVLAKSRSGSRFTVTLQYTTCTKAQQQVCIQSVTVVLDEDVNHQVTLTREGEVLIGVNPAPALPYTGDVVEVRRLTSVFVQLRTLLGLRLQYDGRGGRVYLQLDSQWRSNTLGLCGTFNGNLRDDFLSPAGMIEGTPQLHANSWRVSSACSAPVNQPIIDPCEINQHNVFYASLCEVLLGSVFSPCHGYVSSSVYQQQCRYQACRCGNACLCTALAHYAYLCSKHNVIVNYRAHVSECGMVCLGGMLYQSCVSSCGGSCRSLSSGETCNHDDCAEGCGCSEGSYYDDVRQRCVQPSQCHCYSIGGVSQPGEVSFSAAGPCLCRNGRMECVPEEREPERGQCPEGKVFHSCSEPQGFHGFQGAPAWRGGVACELTCRNLMLNLTCPPTTPCIPGCVCQQGLVLHRGECYYPENCPCAWLGLEYLPGETVDTPCYRCVCHRGYFNCSHSPCPAVCTVYSDRHYHTFDGLEYDYHSDCQVYLLKSTDGEVSIVAQNKDCYQSGIICMKMLVIHVGFTKIYFNDNSGQPSPSSVVGKGSEFELWSAGYYTAIHFPYQDLTILWDRKTTVHIRVGPHWKGLLSGLCGNFDSVTVNDMTTSSHMEVSNAQGFGDSWALGQCESDYVVKRACEGDLGRQPYAKRECALLYSDVFTPCHNVVDVSWFYMNCLTDTCNCNRGGDCECLCTSIAAYAHTCCQHGVTVVWRNPSVCPYDCEYYNQELGEGPFSVVSAVFNATVFGVNRTSGSVFPLVREFVGGLPPPGLLFNFMITAGLQKDRTSRIPVISLESAERPNYFLVVSDRAGLRLEQWTRGEKFGRRASFLQHQGLFLPGHTSLELIGQPGVFLTLTRTSARAQRYDNSDNFKTSSSFTLEESSFVIPFRMMCEWRYHACASPCVRTCSDLEATRCHFLPPVEGCFPRCPKNMVLDEVTRRCVYTEDCVSLPPTPTPYAFVNQTTTTPTTTITAPTTTTTALTTTTTAPTTTTTAPTTTTTATTTITTAPTTTTTATTTTTTATTTITTAPTTTTTVPTTTTTATTTITTAPTTTTTAPTTTTTAPTTTTTASTTTTTAPTTTTTAPTTTTTAPTTTITDPTTTTTAPTTTTTAPTTTITGPTTITTAPTNTTTAPTTTTTAPTNTTTAPTTTTTAPTTTTTAPTTTTTAPTTTTTGPTTTTTAPTTTTITITTTTTDPATTTIVTTSTRTTTSAASTTVTATRAPTTPSTAPLTERFTHTPTPARSPSPPLPSLPSPTVTEHTTSPAVFPSVSLSSSVSPSSSPTTTSSTTGVTTLTLTHSEVTTVASPIPPSLAVTDSTTPPPPPSATPPQPSTQSSISPPATTSFPTSSLPPPPLSPSTHTPTTTQTHRPVATPTETISVFPVVYDTSSVTMSTLPPETTEFITTETSTSTDFFPTSEAVSMPTVLPPFLLPTAPCTPPYSYRVDECTELICFNGELLLHNSSLHCRYNTTPPRCSLLGMAVLTNTDPCCPLWQCPCRCSVMSDLRVITFDGNNVALYDNGSYILVYLPRENIIGTVDKCPTSQSVNSIRRPSPSGGTSGLCFKKLNITTPSYRIIINRLDRKVSVNHIKARLPFSRKALSVEDTGSMYLITTPGGVNIQWYHSTGIMVLQYTAPSNTSAPTRGLCGCCDGNPADDLKLPNGTVVREVADLGLFLQAWRVQTSEDTEHTRRIGDNCTTGDCSTCLSMLRQRPFTPCHSKVSPEQFCDVMWAGDLHYKAHQCDFLAAYVAICYTYQVCINWRRHNFCPLRCPPGREYQACVSTCTTRTCQNREFYEETTCSHIREECVCRSGTILHRADSSYCVTEEQCVCTDNEGSPRAPGEVWNGSLRGCCLFRCLENGSVVAVEPDCSISPTLLCEREGEYVLDVLEEGACCPRKICECNLTICESEAPPCENGNQLVIGYSGLSCCPEYRCECDPHACPPLTPPDCREDQFLVEVREDNSCCYSFLCVCESCIEPVPSCSYGEILAVDLNTTHSCCPQYHCVCDVNLCPESTLSCSPGLSLIQTTLPGHCCPDRHCECQCEDSSLPVCQVGEVQVEFADSRSTCGCPLYTCKKAEVCVFQGVTVLGPGQSLIQYYEGELCYTVHCLTHRDTHTGYYAMDVSAVNCSQKCGQHQLYVASSDPQVCCGSCKNVSCSFNNDNGTTELFTAGSSWVDNCTRYDCVETTVGTVMLASGVVCPPFNDTECTQNGGVVQSYVDGCCRTCKEDGKTCKRVAIRTTIRKDDCRSNAPVTVFSCDGKCPSATIFNFNINSHARFCKCCRESGLQTRSVTLYCSHNATLVVYSFQEPVDCSCQWN
ncbi:otogelin-like protein isoform X2 [Salvelinus fontinalis]|uniref:otogelin-like protein isoform X2 n=1 Tax=Salvelinus fontinalis TaxID=8038 RepID=UPI002485F857|nr:otogelin-like protein isoform X2 [Salvelinus fontinalis]